jgi:acyl carrier protein
MQNLEREIRGFIVENFLYGDESVSLSGQDSFVERGIVDSTGILELVAFLEDRYKIDLADDELVPENLDSINGLLQFIAKKRGDAAGAENAG